MDKLLTREIDVLEFGKPDESRNENPISRCKAKSLAVIRLASFGLRADHHRLALLLPWERRWTEEVDVTVVRRLGIPGRQNASCDPSATIVLFLCELKWMISQIGVFTGWLLHHSAMVAVTVQCGA